MTPLVISADADQSFVQLEDGRNRIGAMASPLDCAPFILRVMSERRLGLRKLAAGTSIGKSRLGSILHRNSQRRHPMTLVEFHAILEFLKIDPLDAIIRIMPLPLSERLHSPRYAALLAMLCEMFRGLAASMIEALDQIDGLDGTEVRPEWAPALRQAVVKRVVHEVHAVAARRAAIGDFNIFG